MTQDAIRVRILPFRSVVIGDRARGAGWEGDVPSEDAYTLVSEGYAELASEPRKTRRAAPKAPKRSRRPLTVEALEDGEGERG